MNNETLNSPEFVEKINKEYDELFNTTERDQIKDQKKERRQQIKLACLQLALGIKGADG